MNLSVSKRIMQATALITVLAACATQPPSESEPAILAIEPLPADHEIVTSYTPQLSEVSEDGRWSVTWLTRGHVRMSSKLRSSVVITDLARGRHYDLPKLQGMKARSFHWDSNNLVQVEMYDYWAVVDVDTLDAVMNQVAVVNYRSSEGGGVGFLPATPAAIPNSSGGN